MDYLIDVIYLYWGMSCKGTPVEKKKNSETRFIQFTELIQIRQKNIYTICIQYMYTVVNVLQDCSFCHQKVVLSDRWSCIAGSLTWEIDLQTRGLSLYVYQHRSQQRSKFTDILNKVFINHKVFLLHDASYTYIY